MKLVGRVHALARKFPSAESYVLGAQLRRAAISIPANIAEGYGRATARDYAGFLSIVRGSVLETETLLLLANDFGYIDNSEVERLLGESAEISKMLSGLRRHVVEKPSSASRPLR